MEQPEKTADGRAAALLPSGGRAATVAGASAGFHVDDGFRYADGTHFEIQRWAYNVKMVPEVGFRQAINLAKEKIEANLDPRFANEILGHEVVRGYQDLKW